uniref:28 kDa ribonucleoproteinic-like n=1 Tax=Rhizophora mucronata TaxID=61149 RepID=A0A2P2LNQ1_RHIMU
MLTKNLLQVTIVNSPWQVAYIDYITSFRPWTGALWWLCSSGSCLIYRQEPSI